MLIPFTQLSYTEMHASKPGPGTEIFLNPAYVVSLAQKVELGGKSKDKHGRDVCYLTMASRGDPEEGNDYYTVLGLAKELTSRVNEAHATMVL